MIHSHLVEGRLADKPRMVTTAKGAHFATFRILHNSFYRDRDGIGRQGKTRSLDITCWRDMAQRVLSLNKGDLVMVECGDDLYATTNGQYTNISVSASNVFVSMRYDAATSHRQPKTPTGNTIVTGDGEHLDAAEWAARHDIDTPIPA